MKIQLSKIDIEQSVQVRAAIHGETVDRYAEHLQTPGAVPLPPIVVFGPDSRGFFFLSEGWHRYEAHKKAKRSAMLATVKEGGWKEALEHALGSNAAHGLPRSNKDKRRVVELALMHWPTWSSRLIAEKCQVSHTLVDQVRDDQLATVASSTTGQPAVTPPGDEAPTPPSQALTSTPPTRAVLGKDGKVRSVPSRPPPVKRPATAPVAPPDNVPMPGPAEAEDVQPLDTSRDELPVDQLGKTVLPHLVSLWQGGERLRGMVASIREVRLAIEQAVANRDPLFCGNNQGMSPVPNQSLVAALKRAENELKAGIPFAVCGTCNGVGCRGCSGNGLVTELQYERLAPEFRR